MAKVGYARVSTKKQNLDIQIKALEAVGCDIIFSEHVSSVKDKRPEFQMCLTYLRPGDELYLYSLCRLGRNSKELIQIKQDLDAKNIAIRSLEFDIDTSTSQGNMFFQVYASILEFQRRWTVEKTVAGLAAARERYGGKFKARSSKLDTRQKDVLIDMHRSKKYSYAEMARTFCVSRSTVGNIIKNHVHSKDITIPAEFMPQDFSDGLKCED